MTFKTALDNLCANYSKYGMTREIFSDLLKDGVRRGISVKGAYNSIKMTVALQTGEREYFSVDDVCEMTGETREEVLQRIEEMRTLLISEGKDPDKYFTPLNNDNVEKFTINL